MPALEFDAIVSIVQQRRQQDSPLKREMIAIRDRYAGDYVIPLPDVDKEPTLPPISPSMIADAIDNTAMRAASQKFNIVVPALHPLVDLSVEHAHTHRRALYATHRASHLNLGIHKAFRHLAGYGEMSMVVEPDFVRNQPRIAIRDPLTTYPEPRAPEDVRTPMNVAYVYGRSAHWIMAQYPEAKIVLDAARQWDVLWDVCEWIDEDQIIIGILGPRQSSELSLTASSIGNPGAFSMMVRRWDNRAGIVPVAAGQRVTLDRVAGQVARIVGVTDLLDRLLALDYMAVEKAVFPDRYAIGVDGRTPQIVGGRWKDGRHGETNLLQDVRAIGELNAPPGGMTTQMASMLERSARIGGGNSGAASGELNGSLRSGQTINSLAAISSDPRIQELQEVMQSWLEVVNKGITAVYKGYWGNKTFSMYTGRPSDGAVVEFTPNTDFEHDESAVTYPMPGLDVSQLSVAVNSLIASQVASQHTARILHPMIDDPEGEESLIREEAAQRAIEQGFLQQVGAGTIPIKDAAAVYAELRKGQRWDEAILKVDEAAQKRQATAAPAPEPGQVAAPATMPGLASPGMGAEAPPTIEGNNNLDKLRKVMGALRSTNAAA